jgi:sugar phosphate isomerase/epimerase
MNSLSRKDFLQQSALLCATIVAGSAFSLPKKQLLLSFSTLGCPDWTFQQITDFAQQHGYKGIEVRGILRQMDLTRCPEFSTADNRKATLQLMKSKGLQFVGLGSSSNLHLPEGAEREKSLSEAKQFIDLAQQIGCPYVRVFPNNLPKDQDKNATIGLIINGLQQLGEYARGKNVTVLMETHGDLVHVADLETIMQAAGNKNVALVWDVANMWTVTKEPPAMVYGKLKSYIRHAHIKDAKLVGDKLSYTFLGQGDVPIFEAIDVLAKSGYKGFYSFEWEKMWHPEIAEPELALADYPTAMKQHFKSL